MLDLVSFYLCSGFQAECYPLNRGDLLSQSDEFENGHAWTLSISLCVSFSTQIFSYFLP